MTIITKYVKTKWNGQNRKRYEGFGYHFTGINSDLEVKVEHLSFGSKVRINALCDVCGKEVNVGYGTYVRNVSKNSKYMCSRECVLYEENIKLYGTPKTVSTNSRILADWDFDKNKENPQYVLLGSGRKFFWKCKKGHSYKSTLTGRTRGHGCSLCAGKGIRTDKNLAETNPELIAEWADKKPIEEVTRGSSYKARWKCSKCGNIWRAMVQSRTILKTGCNQCFGSKGEETIRDLLIEMNIPHVREYSFEDLVGIGGRPLRFDFAIMSDGMVDGEVIGLIEVDGEFHRQDVNRDGSYSILREHDRRKNHYSEANEIPLLRIDYNKSELESGYEMKLRNFLEKDLKLVIT